MKLRVVVYNVKGFRAGADAVANALVEYHPDLALINECGTRGKLRTFARRLGMVTVSGPLFFLLRVPRNALLVRPPWRVTEHRLHRFERTERFYPRGALVAQIGRAGERLTVLCVHLGLVPAERRRHAGELTDLARTLPEPLVIGGDFNDGPQGKAPAWVGERYWDAWIRVGEGTGETFPASDPTARIDYLFASEDVRFEQAAVLGSTAARTASDHVPLLVDLYIGD